MVSRPDLSALHAPVEDTPRLTVADHYGEAGRHAASPAGSPFMVPVAADVAAWFMEQGLDLEDHVDRLLRAQIMLKTRPR